MELQQQNQDKKEQRILKQKIEILERENHALKKSLYELSTRFNALKVQPLVLSELLTKSPDESTNYDSKELPDTSGYSRENRPKQFSQKSEFKGHAGAVYIVKFSSCGRLLGSGSFDKSIRIWDWSGQKEQLVLNGHELNISDLSWSQSSSLLLSGAYDQTCKIWDIEQGKLLESYDTDGFVQCVAFNPIDSNIFFSGTSRNILEMKDRRIKVGSGLVFKNDSMVNTMYKMQLIQVCLFRWIVYCIW
jgi:COMPASS component SWD3